MHICAHICTKNLAQRVTARKRERDAHKIRRRLRERNQHVRRAGPSDRTLIKSAEDCASGIAISTARRRDPKQIKKHKKPPRLPLPAVSSAIFYDFIFTSICTCHKNYGPEEKEVPCVSRYRQPQKTTTISQNGLFEVFKRPFKSMKRSACKIAFFQPNDFVRTLQRVSNMPKKRKQDPFPATYYQGLTNMGFSLCLPHRNSRTNAARLSKTFTQARTQAAATFFRSCKPR